MSKKKNSQSPDTGLPNFSAGRYGGSPKPPVERLPILGTTWHDRGFAYWARRALIFLIILVAVACQVLFVWAIFYVISSDTSKSFTFRAIAIAIVGLCVLGGFVYWARWFVQIEQRKRRGEIAYPEYRPRGVAGGAVAGGVGSLARSGDSTASGCAFAASILTAGAAPFLIIRTLQKEYVYEHDARIRLEQWRNNQDRNTGQ